MFKILWKLQKISVWGVVKILNRKWVIISRQISDSPPPQQGACEPIFSGLTGLCIHLLYPNLFRFQISIIPPTPSPPKKNNQNAPLT